MEVNNKMSNRDGKGLEVKKGGSFRTKMRGKACCWLMSDIFLSSVSGLF